MDHIYITKNCTFLGVFCETCLDLSCPCTDGFLRIDLIPKESNDGVVDMIARMLTTQRKTDIGSCPSLSISINNTY